MSVPDAVDPDLSGDETGVEDDKLPFSFILTIVMVGLYVGYRIVQLLWRLGEWLIG